MKQFLRLGDGYALMSTYDTEKKLLARGPLGIGFETASEILHLSDAVYTPAGAPVSALSAEKSRNCRGEAAEQLAGHSEFNQEAFSLNGVAGLTLRFSRGLAMYKPPISHVCLRFNMLVIPGKRVGNMTDIPEGCMPCIVCHPSPKPNIFATFVVFVLALFMCLTAAMQVSAQQAEPADAVNKQRQTITGTVVDTAGQPIQGATVSIIGASVQTQTDEYGRFSLRSAVGEGMLRVRFVGYQTLEVPFDGETNEPIWFALTPTENLIEEVEVNTGYQAIPKERATGSFVFVDSALLNRAVSTDIISRLKGVVPSLLFDERGGGEPKLSIRGRSTIYANADPLIVVDNFPYEGDIRNINPNDVESVSILRDAAAASIWGVRAGNGVIVITTKKGKAGQPLQVSFNSNVTVGAKPDLWYEPRISPADMIDVETFLFENGYYTAQLNNTVTFPAISPAVEIMANAALSNIERKRQLDQLRIQDIRYDVADYFYQPEIKQQYTLAITGGGKNHGVYLAGGFDQVNDVRIGNGFDRVNVSFQNQIIPFENLNVTAGIFYSYENRQRNSIHQDVQTTHPYIRLVDEQGTPLSISKDYRASFVQNATEMGLLDWRYVPLDELQLAENGFSTTAVRANSSWTYNVTSALSIDVRYQYEQQNGLTRNLNSEETYYTRNLINSYSAVGSNGITRNIPLGAYLYLGNSHLSTHNGRAQLNYELNQQDHEIYLLGGFEARQAVTNGHDRNYYGYDILSGLGGLINPDSLYIQYPAGTRSRIPVNNSVSNTIDRFRSFFFNGTYTYRSRYTLSASARVDQSNIFGVTTNQRSIPLWSAGFKWVAHQEDFFQSIPFSRFAIKTTFGYNGNFDPTLTAFTTAEYGLTGGIRNARIVSPPNPNLRWEKNAVFNAELDFGLNREWLSGTIAYYRRWGLDLIGRTPLEPTTGILSYRGNVANMVGNGWDVALSSANIDRSNFRWNTEVLFSYTVDKVTHYEDTDAPVGSYFGESLLDGIIPPREGQPLSGFYSFPWAGLSNETGAPQGFLNGMPSTNYSAIVNALTFDSLVYHGTALPPVFGALRNNFSLGQFDLSFNITYKFGHYFRRTSVQYDLMFRGMIGHSDFSKRWLAPGDEHDTDVPAMIYPANSSRDNYYSNASVLVEKADHIRFQDIRLSYRIPSSLMQRFAFQSCIFYLYANNLGVLWSRNKQYVDPDYSPRRRAINGGTMVLPPRLSVALGINLTL